MQYTDPTIVTDIAVDEQAPGYGSASGYGSKIPTRFRVCVAGRWRRVYMMQYSNSGSAYIVVDGQDWHLDTETEYALEDAAC